MTYAHTQYAPMYWVLIFTALFELVFAAVLYPLPLFMLLMLVLALLTFGLAFSFRQLTVQDEGEWLGVRYGPIPVFRTRIRYADMVAVESCRSSLMDGFGIHYTPGRGWIYNLWGFDCVKIVLGKKIVRIGTDDRENLVAFLSSKITQPQPSG